MGDILSDNAEYGGLVPSDFVHLHNHTHYSVLDGLTKVGELVDYVKSSGMEACAITDHGTMSGTLDFYKTATAAGIKPILGLEAYVAARSRHDRDPAKDKARYHLTMLSMNIQGFRNLMALSSKANLEGMYYRPRIDHELIEMHNEGLIVLSGCAGGELGELFRSDDYEGAKKLALWYKGIFGDRYYLEMQDHGHPDAPNRWDVQTKINGYVRKLSEELNIKRVVTCDAHYLCRKDKEAHEILLCVGTGAYLSDQNRMSLKEFDLHVTDPNEIIKRWGKTDPEAISNTKAIADRCNVEIELGKILIPRFPTPNNESEKDYFHQLVYKGMAVRYGKKEPAEAEKLSRQQVRDLLEKNVLERLDMELSVIDRMGYNGYFLIVQDFINWGKDQGIIFGPGRGSAAGSIIAYSLNITDLDPIKYKLLFERFLNPDRISMPDIDVDIQDTRRDEVVQYCARKYGEDHVSNIVTFGTMAARAAVRDVARVLQVPYSESDRMAKLIPQPAQGHHIPLKVSVKEDPDLRKEYETNPVAKEVFDYAIRLEGTIRSHGVHACGVVIAPDKLMKYIPLEYAQKGVVSTQFPMTQVEELGLLKMDFLGLSNLTIINNTLRIIKKIYKQVINISNLSLDDEEAYKLLQRGDTTGVFQLESAGMKRYLKDLEPTSFDDIIAMVALYRPGPMQFIDSFIKRKHGVEKITYLHSGMENSLKDTYGIMVYQEQFMQISKEWCGFTGGQADTLRKAVGKKKIDLMKKVKPEFIEGAVKVGGATKEIAETFWTQLEEFANYCFNKSHAACYAMIAYWTAYLKAHFPDAFMAALMTSDHDDTDRLAIEITECKHMGINVLSPDVNESFVEFSVVPNKKEVRFGMAAVKGVGVGAVEEVLRAREEGGSFKSIEDFAKRVSTTKFNRKAWESLIKAGGFDSFGNRSDLLFNLDTIQAFASKIQKDTLNGQTDIFGMLSADSASGAQPTLTITPAPKQYSNKEQLMWERELLGLYISAHPLDNYTVYLDEQTIPLNTINQDLDGRPVTIGGIISNVRTIITKNGSKMAFVGIEDKYGEAEIIVFPNLFEKIGVELKQDAVIVVNGKVNAKDKNGNTVSDVKIIADTIVAINDEEIMTYQTTGKKIEMPKYNAKARNKNYSEAVSKENKYMKAEAKETETVKIDPPKIQKLYVLVDTADDSDSLCEIKKYCTKHPGLTETILVIGKDKKTAMRLPFRVDGSDSLVCDLVKQLGEDHVALK